MKFSGKRRKERDVEKKNPFFVQNDIMELANERRNRNMLKHEQKMYGK